MKNKETLEEAGLKHCELIDNFPALENPLFSFKEGAKWQTERHYSEEEIIDLLQEINDLEIRLEGRIAIRKWFTQFKKK